MGKSVKYSPSPWMRLAALLLAGLMGLGGVTTAFAGGGEEDATPGWAWGADEDTLPTGAGVGVPELPCQSAILVEETTGRVLYEKNADAPMAPASITKVMTMLLVVEGLEEGTITLEDRVVCSPHANSMGGTQIWLEIGEQMSVRDLLKAVAVGSANDASVLLAEHLAGSEEAFTEGMNRRAAELGMANTHFVNATGLDAPGHLTTARDIATMSRELMGHEMIREYTSIWMDTLREGETQLVNTNKLIRFYKGATGLKTGTTDDAGSCLAATATRGNLRLVAVSLGSRTSDERFASCRSLLDYGFATFDAVESPTLSEELPPLAVKGGVEATVALSWERPAYLVLPKGQKDKVEHSIALAPDLAAPVEKGQMVGTVTLTVAGETVGEYPVHTAAAVEEMTLWRAFGALWLGLVR